MDLSSMLNDEGAAAKRSNSQKSSPEAQRNSLPAGAPIGVPGGSGAPPTPLYAAAGYPPTPYQQPGAQDYRSTSQPRGLTPLQTPAQQPNGASYPFPSQAAPSPSSAHPLQRYNSYDFNPGSRPQSYGHPQAHQSPAQYAAQSIPQSVHHTQSTSLSPTPSSHHGQTPHSMRQSPLSTMNTSYTSQHSHHQHLGSQPGTPLGPPPLNYQRTSMHSHHDNPSPVHQRTFSGQSNGALQSPAQHHPSIGNLMDSPSAYNRPPPQRRTSQYLQDLERERERSLSVSPKTKVPPRPPSMGSRHSSQEQIYSRHSSMQQPQEVQTHVTYTPVTDIPKHNIADAGFAAHGQSSMVGVPGVHGPPPFNPLSQSEQQPPTLQHKMGMNHLLSSATDSEASRNGSPVEGNAKKRVDASVFMAPRKTASPRPGTLKSEPSVDTDGSKSQQASGESPLQQPLDEKPATNGHASQSSQQVQSNLNPDSKPPLKRPAESILHPPEDAKRTKKRKYTERPIWAQYATSNPRYSGSGGRNGTASNSQSQQVQGRVNVPVRREASAAPMSMPMQQTNGHGPSAGPADEDPSWEKTITQETPIPDMVRCVCDWLFMEIPRYKDIGTGDPSSGAFEIEAKLGTLMRVGEESRVQLPVATAVAIPAEVSRNYRFESKMDVAQHKKINDFLNEALKATLSAGPSRRKRMDYVHRKEKDCFATLSAAGTAALPQSIQNMKHEREFKLRTTFNENEKDKKLDGKAKIPIASIVKVTLSNLHIYSPRDLFDLRISLNVEVPLDRDLVEPSNPQKQQPDRHKDRMSYTHQAYQIDLTMVNRATCELEIEVDSTTLTREMDLVVAGQKNNFVKIVEGLLDNATLLMRIR